MKGKNIDEVRRFTVVTFALHCTDEENERVEREWRRKCVVLPCRWKKIYSNKEDKEYIYNELLNNTNNYDQSQGRKWRKEVNRKENMCFFLDRNIKGNR